MGKLPAVPTSNSVQARIQKGLTMNWDDYSGWDAQALLDSTDKKQGFLLLHNKGHYVRLSPSAYRLLSGIRAGMSFEELSTLFNTENGQKAVVTPEQIRYAYERLTRGISDRSAATGDHPKLPFGFWVNYRVLPAQWVGRISATLTSLYNLNAVIVLFALIFVALFVASMDGLQAGTEAGVVLQGYLLFLGSLLAHEFGHAAACARFGAQPREIGIALYLIYPAFYSDVSAAWSLPRWQRVVVDLGGCYFQMAAGGLFACVFLASHWEPLRFALMLIIYSCAFSLNPIFRFDGYWVVADGLGVVNLGSQPVRIAKHVWSILCRNRHDSLPWPRWIVLSLVVYSIAAVSVWSIFIWQLLPLLRSSLRTTYDYSLRVWTQLAVQHHVSGSDLGSLLVSASLLLIVSVASARIAMAVIRPLIKRLHAHFKPMGPVNLARDV